MIDFVSGNIVYKDADSVVVNCGCFGIRVFVTSRLLSSVKCGEEVLLYVQLVIPSEGTLNIYGFSSKQERELFKTIIKVPRIGAKVSMNLLSCFGVDELKSVISSNDIHALSHVPGLGEKLAGRIIFELKSKLRADRDVETELAEIVDILKSLGYSKKDVLKVVRETRLEGLNLEDAVKIVIGKLSGGKFGE